MMMNVKIEISDLFIGSFFGKSKLKIRKEKDEQLIQSKRR